LAPPVKVLSLGFGSGLCTTLPAACNASQSISALSLAWLPSPPWKLEPASGADVGTSGAARAGAASATTTPAATSASCRITRRTLVAAE
jgi:hypothetical protein